MKHIPRAEICVYATVTHKFVYNIYCEVKVSFNKLSVHITH
jgi:hypothetical protein